MMTAMLCVENILADTKLYDLWQVNGDAEYHEAGAVPEEQEQGTGLRLVPTRVVDYARASARSLTIRRLSRSTSPAKSRAIYRSCAGKRTHHVRARCILCPRVCTELSNRRSRLPYRL